MFCASLSFLTPWLSLTGSRVGIVRGEGCTRAGALPVSPLTNVVALDPRTCGLGFCRFTCSYAAGVPRTHASCKCYRVARMPARRLGFPYSSLLCCLAGRLRQARPGRGGHPGWGVAPFPANQRRLMMTKGVFPEPSPGVRGSTILPIRPPGENPEQGDATGPFWASKVPHPPKIDLFWPLGSHPRKMCSVRRAKGKRRVMPGVGVRFPVGAHI